MAFVCVVPIYFTGPRTLLPPLGEALERAFRLPVEVRPAWFDPEVAFDPSRGQYSSTLLLAQLLAGTPAGAVRILGLTTVDLFIPILTYVFGEAQLDGSAAVVSTHRLRNELYGIPPDEDVLGERLEKEAVHELGHTWGLVHCPDSLCVMRSSTYVEEIDLKGAAFCAACRRRLSAGTGEGGLQPA